MFYAKSKMDPGNCCGEYEINFSRMKQWMGQYEQYLKNQFYSPNHNIEKNNRIRSSEYNQRKRIRNKKRRKAKQKCNKYNYSGDAAFVGENEDAEEFEMLITEEMKEFFRISQEHKKSRGLSYFSNQNFIYNHNFF